MSTPTGTHSKLRIAALLFAVLLVSALIGVAVSMATASSATPTITELDKDTGLDGQHAKGAFKQKGHVTVDVSAPALSITVSKKAKDAGLSSYRHSDTLNDFVCVDYQEDIPRKIRFYVPAEPYFDAFNKESMTSIDGTHSAEFSRIRGGEYTSVVVEFDRAAEACFKISEAQSRVWGVVGQKEEQVENSTGVRVPQKSEWSYIDSSEWQNRSSVELDSNSTDNLIVEYDATSNGADEEKWVVATDERGDSDRLSWFSKTRSDGERVVVLVSRYDETPTVRYKKAESSRDLFGSIKRDIDSWGDKAAGIMESIGSLFGDGGDSNGGTS